MNEQTNGTTAKAPEGRTANGRFAPGNKGGPGNPFARQVAALLKAAADAATPERVAEVMEALFQKARQGDVAAAKVWLGYSAGPPQPGPDPDTIDAHELDTRVRNVPTAEHLEAMKSVPAAQMCGLGRVVSEVAAHKSADFILDKLAAMDRADQARTEASALRATPSPTPSQAGKAERPPADGEAATAMPGLDGDPFPTPREAGPEDRAPASMADSRRGSPIADRHDGRRRDRC